MSLSDYSFCCNLAQPVLHYVHSRPRRGRLLLRHRCADSAGVNENNGLSSSGPDVLKRPTNMRPRIETLPEKKLVGKRINMSLANDKTRELWQSFMPLRKQITNTLTTDLFSLQVYDESVDASRITLDATFDKWAAVEVADFDAVPETMETYTLESGLYAVFIHKGRQVQEPKHSTIFSGRGYPLLAIKWITERISSY